MPNAALRTWTLGSAYALFDLPFMLDRRGNPRHALARSIPDQPLRVLDVCCGPGNTLLAIARANLRNHLIGVDLSPAALTVAAGRARRRGLGNVNLCRMDAAHLAFDDASVDVASITFGLHELEPEVMWRVLGQLGSVLAPGGRLYIVDFAQETTWLRRTILGAFLKLVEPAHMPWFLELDWTEALARYGLRLDSSESYAYSRLMSAVRVAPDVV
jgi:ubiquinone/menaquinone biosynthesis C-methylase UbiE